MKLGQYELLGRIAVGGMAEIYRGRAVGEEGFEKLVAIKRILPHFARDTRFVTMLVTEARIHASLSHRNIVQIHDLGISEDGEYFIVLEYVDGRDLGALLAVLHKTASPGGRTLRPSDAVGLYIAAELAEGVHFAHELCGADGQPLGLIHRDISPTNVLVSYAAEVKLSDFGLAKRRADQSVVGSIKGKLAYMAPEQARRSTLDRRSDIFSMGAVLFELLTGRRLREITDEIKGWEYVASGAMPSPRSVRPDLPPVLEQLLARALAVDPQDRFADALSFGQAARAALDQVPRAPTSEAAELQGLMRALLPPGSPRQQVEPSKVIRLVSEFIHVDGLPGVRSTPRPRNVPPPLPPGLPVPQKPLNVPPSAPSWFSGPSRTPTRAPSGDKLIVPPRPTGQQMGAQTGPTPLPTPLMALGSDPTPAPPHVHLAPGIEQTPPPKKRGTALLIGLLLVLSGAAAVVHLVYVPLPMLRKWPLPARLEVTSRPIGAQAYVDGQPVTGVTPSQIYVRRDRREHAVEFRKEGYQTTTRTVRYDHTEKMQVTALLETESRPAFEPLPAPPRSDAGSVQRSLLGTAGDAGATPPSHP